MTALTTDFDRQITLVAGSLSSTLALLVNAKPFVGSMLSKRTDGFIAPLTAGEPFAGVALQRYIAGDWKVSGAASGDLRVRAATGRFWMRCALAVTQADVIKRRTVYASDDATFSFAAAGNTKIGELVDIESTTVAIVECTTAEARDAVPGGEGVVVLPDAPTTLDMTHVGKVLHAPVTAARAYTLPPVADWLGKYITIVNAGGAFAVTITPNGAEKIGSAASLVQVATRGRSTVLYGAGTTGDEVTIIANQ